MSDMELAVFARAPKAGQVKTRLAPLLGESGALQAHRELVVGTLARIASIPEISLWVSAIDDEVRQWAEHVGGSLSLQHGDHLGARMLDCLRSCLDRGRTRVCLMGTDCPEIDAEYVHSAFAALAQAQVVIAPAEDGGYGLIGVRADAYEKLPALFDDVPWSTDSVTAVTHKRAESVGLQMVSLPQIWDVDRPEDWHRYRDMDR